MSSIRRFSSNFNGALVPAAALWIAWPKKASTISTDVTEDVVREVALPLALVDAKDCAIDATWSGLKLVWSRDRRGLTQPRGCYRFISQPNSCDRS
jgi:hypothetical protein